MASLLSVRARSVGVLAVFLLALQVVAPAQPLTGTISGTVADALSNPLGFFNVEIVDAGGNQVTVTAADENGMFSVPDLAPGTYYARTFNFVGYVDEWYGGVMARFGNFAEGTPIVLGDGATENISFVLDLGGVIDGQITADGTGDPIGGVSVEVYDGLGRFVGLTWATDGTGFWSTLTGLPTGTYYLKTYNTAEWVDELYDGVLSYTTVQAGTPVSVTAGENSSGIDFALAVGGRISGYVKDHGDNYLANVTITVKDGSGAVRASGTTDAFGGYTTGVLPAGSYYVIASDAAGHIPQIYQEVDCLNCGITGGAPVAVTSGASTADIDFELADGGTIAGTVTVAGTADGIAGVRVDIYDSTGHLVGTTAASVASGSYVTEFGLPSGTYYAGTSTDAPFVNEAYNDLPISTPVLSRTAISVTIGQATQGIDFSLQPSAPEISVTQGSTPVATGDTYGFGPRMLTTDTDVVFTIANAGGVSLTADTLPLVPGGTDADQFSIVAQPVFPVASLGSTTFTVRFHPTSAGAKAASVSFGTNDADENPFVINLTGTGITQPITPVITWPAPSPIWFGTPLTILQLNAQANIPGAFAYTPDFGAVLPVGAHTLSVLFTPSDAVNYTTASAEVGLVVVSASGAVPGDFNADLRADILWHHDSLGDVWLWPMDGTTKLAESYVRNVSDTGWQIRSLGDQTGDGRADIMWRHAVSGQLYFWPMNGSTPLDEIYVGTVSTDYDIVGSGDFNGDGKADLLWRHATLGDVWIWLMDGATPLAEVYVDRVDPAYLVKGVGDLDGDGRADIVWHHATLGEVWVWPMAGTTRLDQVWIGTVPDVGYQIEAVADFDGDAKADIVWRHATLGEVWMWPMSGTTRLSETWVTTVSDTGYRIVATGDYDGDGRSDLLWHHATLGEVWMWLMNGATRLSETWIETVPDTGYKVVK